MIVFNAGNCRLKGSEEEMHRRGMTNRLMTFAEKDELPREFAFWLDPTTGGRFFLDSGAFSAFTRDLIVDLGEYIEYVEEHRDRLFCYAVLDVIGDAKATRLNYLKMKKAGLIPVAAFHYGSEFRELERYCKEGCEFIALGGLVPHSSSPQKLRTHLDSCWSILKKHWPIKVHAFGVTAQWILERYPFYSCDSTIAVVGGGMGRVIEFDGRKISTKMWQKAARAGRTMHMVDCIDGTRHMARMFQQPC